MPSPNLGIEAVSFAYSESLTATRFALTRLDPARRAGRRSGTRKTRPRRVPVVIAGEMGGRGESLRAFGKLPDPMEDRQQVDVGERELRVDEIAAGERLTVCWRAGGRWIRTSGSWSRGRQTVMGEVTAFSKPGADLLGNRRFESISLQQGVHCELDPNKSGAGAADPWGAHPAA